MKNSKSESRTDWARVRREAASGAPIAHDPETELYDPDDDAAVVQAWAQGTIRRSRGPQRAPTKERISIRLSPEVVQHFRAGGRGWQTQLDEVLQEWVKRHRTKRKK